MKRIITRLKFVFLLSFIPTFFITAILLVGVLLTFTGGVWAQNAALLPGNIVSCNTTIYDRGGAGNYTSSTDEWITIAGRPGATITITGTYALEACNCDYVRIRDGYGNAGAILQTHTNGLGTITSYTGAVGQTLTVQLTSDGSVVAGGFVATVTYSVAQTCPTYYSVSGSGTQATTCGTNYILKDHAGDNTSYNNSRNDWIALNNTSGSPAVINITGRYATESTYDFIRIYNGSGIGGTLLTSFSDTGLINYSGTAGQTLTVQFTSDEYTVDAGYSLFASYAGSCVACATVAGTSSSSITNSCGSTSTTLSLAGEGAGTIQWQQSTDGGTTWNNIAGATTDPYVFAATVNAMFRAAVTSGCTSYSTTSSITFSCDIIHPASGFASSTINCGASYTYKDPGNTGNYSDDQNGLITICPSTAGQYVNVNFTAFNTESGFDKVIIFDGDDAGAPILGIYSGNGALSGNVKATSSNTSGCLSFRFTSDGGTVSSGWQATVTCNATPSATVPSSNPEDCQGAYTICSNGTFHGGTNNYGFDELPYQWNSCLAIDPARGEYESTWAVFSPATSGTIGFSITPTSAADYDWAIWGPYSSLQCPAYTNDVPIRCSSTSLANTGNPGTTGLIAPATDVIEQNGEYGGGSNENGKLKPLDVIAGEIYVMMLDNWDANLTTFALNWNLTNGATLDCTPVLPVTMSSFNSLCKDGRTLLEWSTVSEINNDYFAIERSNQDFQFYEIGRVIGSGNSNINNSYSFLDPSFNDKTTYYRIKQVDFNGEFAYHRIVASNCYKTEFEVVNHQLTSNNLEILVNSFEKEDVIIYLYDLQGRLIIESNYQLTKGNNKIKLSNFNINSGIYLMNIKGEVHHYQTKLFRK